MKRIFKYKNGEIRVMWDEQFIPRDYECDWYYKKIKKKGTEILKSFLVGVELQINKGGRVCYGMLAAKVLPDNEPNEIKISIAYTNKNTIRYKESSLFNDTFVYKGLPKEYVEQVGNSILGVIEKKESYPQCDIMFEDAANCEVGSSPMLFGIIAEIVVNLICTGTEDEISNMNIEEFTEQYASKCKLIYCD